MEQNCGSFGLLWLEETVKLKAVIVEKNLIDQEQPELNKKIINAYLHEKNWVVA